MGETLPYQGSAGLADPETAISGHYAQSGCSKRSRAAAFEFKFVLAFSPLQEKEIP